ncbi:hypothetical protein F5X96DRAFT_657635, partial [Biscogniauxia mediterranea]
MHTTYGVVRDRSLHIAIFNLRKSGIWITLVLYVFCLLTSMLHTDFHALLTTLVILTYINMSVYVPIQVKCQR